MPANRGNTDPNWSEPRWFSRFPSVQTAPNPQVTNIWDPEQVADRLEETCPEIAAYQSMEIDQRPLALFNAELLIRSRQELLGSRLAALSLSNEVHLKLVEDELADEIPTVYVVTKTPISA